MTGIILQMLKVKWIIKNSITQAVNPLQFICPVICNFKYHSMYRSRSLFRYCSKLYITYREWRNDQPSVVA